MNEPTVILINRALPYNCVGKLTGNSGVEYGISTFEEAFGAHVCRLPLSIWRECKKDVTVGFVRRWGQWEVDIEIEDSPVGGEDVITKIRNASAEQLPAIVSGLSPLVQAVYEKTSELTSPTDKERVTTFIGNGPEPKTATGVLTGSGLTAAATAAGAHTVESLAQVTNFRVMLKIAKEAGVEDADNINSTAALREAILARQLQPA